MEKLIRSFPLVQFGYMKFSHVLNLCQKKDLSCLLLKCTWFIHDLLILETEILIKYFSLSTQLMIWLWCTRGFLLLQVEIFLSVILSFLGNLMGGYSITTLKIRTPVFTLSEISVPAKSPKERAWNLPRTSLIYSPLCITCMV